MALSWYDERIPPIQNRDDPLDPLLCRKWADGVQSECGSYTRVRSVGTSDHLLAKGEEGIFQIAVALNLFYFYYMLISNISLRSMSGGNKLAIFCMYVQF